MKALSLVLFVCMGYCHPVCAQNGAQQDFLQGGEMVGPTGAKTVADAWILQAKKHLGDSEYDEAIKTLQAALDLQAQFLPPNHPDHAATLLQMGIAQIEKSTYATAIPYLEKSVREFQICMGKKSGSYTRALKKLAQAYLYHERFKDAITTLEQLLATQQQFLPTDHPDFGSTYLTFGAFYKYMKNYSYALNYFQQALDILMAQHSPDLNSIASCYSEIGQLQLNQNQPIKALRSFMTEDSIMIESGDYLKGDYLYTCSDLGKAYLALGDFQQAIYWNEKAINIARAHTQSDNLNVATLYLYLGRSQLGNKQFDAAIDAFLTDEAILNRLFGPENNRHYHVYGSLGNAYAQGYLQNGKDSLLDISRLYFERMTAVVESCVRLETLTEARNKVLSEVMPYYEGAIQTEYLFMQRQNNAEKALEKAWQFSETMHSYLLLAATKESNARQFAHIPNSEIQRDSAIQSNIAVWESKRQSLINKQKRSLTDSLVVATDIQISTEKERQIQLRAFFEKNYPDYFQLKHDLKITSISQIQASLSPTQTLLEYFVGDSTLFVFVVQSDTVQLVPIKRDFPLDDWVNACMEGICAYYNSPQKSPALYQRTVEQYAQYAHQLYEKLLLPIVQYLTPELIIVPAESLSKLPFEALLSSAPKDAGNFQTYSFLINLYDIQYAYSATMLQQMSKRAPLQKASGELLAFAPFSETELKGKQSPMQSPDDGFRQELVSLPFSKEEVMRAQKRLGGQSTVLVGVAASKEQFMKLAPGYRILHLATHAQANDQKGEICFLAFSEAIQNSENGLLSVGELYNLCLNADLVVLSACETGIGEHQRGEGILSLARAFAYAGARSIVASLWPVNDQSTMYVMDYFYGGIKVGKAKNKALAAAKRTYLQQHPGLAAHPFFWAGFVGVGAVK